jgi:hypothetical protein
MISWRLLVLSLFLTASALCAQYRDRPVQQENLQATLQDSSMISDGDQLLYILGAGLIYAGIDYVGYNLTRSNATSLAIYRVFQVGMQAALSWLLYEIAGLPAAIGFNVIWWTFGWDFLYYGYAELFNPGGGWDSRGYLKAGVLNNQCNWAWWTPVGITRGMSREKFIAGNTLIAQSLIGTALAIGITLHY